MGENLGIPIVASLGLWDFVYTEIIVNVKSKILRCRKENNGTLKTVETSAFRLH